MSLPPGTKSGVFRYNYKKEIYKLNKKIEYDLNKLFGMFYIIRE